MDIRRTFLGNPDARHRLAGAVVIWFVLLFFLYATYWQGTYADTGVTSQSSAIRAIAPKSHAIGHAHAGAILYIPAALFAVVVHYHSGAVLYTLAAAPVLPIASALARRVFSPQPDVLEADVLIVTLATHLRLSFAFGALAIVIGSLSRYWAPPNERSLSERFLGSSEDRHRALVVITIAGILAAILMPWFHRLYPAYQPFTFAVFGAPVAAVAYFYSRGIVLAWLGDAAVVLGYSVAFVSTGASLDYVLDPVFFVPALMTAVALGSLGVGATIVFTESYALFSRRSNTRS
jgi:hypothetical protein